MKEWRRGKYLNTEKQNRPKRKKITIEGEYEWDGQRYEKKQSSGGERKGKYIGVKRKLELREREKMRYTMKGN